MSLLGVSKDLYLKISTAEKAVRPSVLKRLQIDVDSNSSSLSNSNTSSCTKDDTSSYVINTTASVQLDKVKDDDP